MLGVTWDTIRLFLHVLAATVWVGGQLTLAALVPVLRKAGAGFSAPERGISHSAHLGHHDPSCVPAVESHRSGSAGVGGASQYPYLAVFAGLTKDWMWPDLTTTMSLWPPLTWVAP